MATSPTIALLTDFSEADAYAGIVRGVLAAQSPSARILDLSHAVPPGDIRRASLILWEANEYFPERTVFLAVVDPTVGTSRKCLVCRFPRFDIVCPDNGTLTFLLEDEKTWSVREIARPEASPEISCTFHGRDILAPAAARIANGEPWDAFGDEVPEPARLDRPSFSGNPESGWTGEILYADRFGNAVTSIGRLSFDGRRLDPWLHTGAAGGNLSTPYRVLLADGSALPLHRTYADGQGSSGRFGVVGSSGLLEIAAWQARPSVSDLLRTGSSVRLVPTA
jgi:S-adenosylmethionine hydrolase